MNYYLPVLHYLISYNYNYNYYYDYDMIVINIYNISVVLFSFNAMLCYACQVRSGQVRSSQVWAQDVRERYMYGNSSGSGDRRKR